MGQLTAGLLAAWLTDWCGVEHLREYEVRFTAPLCIGDVVELSGEVTTVEAADGGGPPSRLCGSPRRETARRW